MTKLSDATSVDTDPVATALAALALSNTADNAPSASSSVASAAVAEPLLGTFNSSLGGVNRVQTTQGGLGELLSEFNSESNEVPRSTMTFQSPSAFSQISEFTAKSKTMGATKEVPLFRTQLSTQTHMCCGFIGTSELVFCTKSKDECTTAKHTDYRFKLEPLTAYIGRSDKAAWTNFGVSTLLLDRLEKKAGTLPERLQMDKWKILFEVAKGLEGGPTDVSEMSRDLTFGLKPVSATGLKTPGKNFPESDSAEWTDDRDNVKSEHNVNKAVDDLFISQENKDKWADDFDDELVSHLENIIGAIRTLKNLVLEIQLTANSSANQADVGEDMLNLTASLQAVNNALGTSDGMFPDVFTGLKELSSTMDELIDQAPNSTTRFDIIQRSMLILEGKMAKSDGYWSDLADNWLPVIASHETKLVELAARHSTSIPFARSPMSMSPLEMARLRQSGVATSAPSADTRFQEMSDQIASQQVMIDDLSSQIKAISQVNMNSNGMQYDEVDQFETSLTTEPISYRHWNFPRGQKDVLAFMKTHMTTPGQAWFTDVVSLMSFIGENLHTENGTVLDNIYKSTKVGYGNIGHAITATSFQNTLPGVLGRKTGHSSNSDNNLDSLVDLPGIPSFNVWDGRDSATGKKYFLTRSIKNTGRQIDGWIRADLHGEAQSMAKELLNDSLSMANELVTYLSTSFQDTRDTQRFDDKQAWELTAKCVKRIFTELADVRIVARDGIRVGEEWETAARCLYATLKAHKVMREFMRLDIKNHPSISSEMVKFVCFSQPASDTSDVLNRLHNVESTARQAQGEGVRLGNRLTALEVWKKDTVKSVKKLMDKANL